MPEPDAKKSTTLATQDATQDVSKPAGWTVSQPKGTSPHRCARHAAADAAAQCDRCKRLWCQWCIKHGEERGVKWMLCECGGRGVPIEIAFPPPPRIDDTLADVFAYPARGEGRWILALGAAMFTVLDSIAVSFSRLFLAVLVFGFMVAWLMDVIRCSARGRPGLPAFPDFVTLWDSIGVPILRGLVLLLVTIAPGLTVASLGGLWNFVGVPLLLAGVAILPMALLAVAVSGSLEGLSLVRIVRSIPIVAKPYALAAALFSVVVGMLIGGTAWEGLGFIGPFVTALVALYLVAISGRVLGLLYARHERELGWY